MSKVTNLTRFRKQKARDAKRAQGDTNAAAFGRSKGEKLRDRTSADKLTRHVDGHRRDRPDDGSDT